MRPLHLLLPALLLAACSARPLPPTAMPALPVAAAASAAWYQDAARKGQHIYRIDPARSIIVITVRRGGALARLGHDHVIASRTVTGLVAPQAGRADFQFRLDQLTVDEAALRAAAGLDTQPSAEAIAGTRGNMLGRVLDAERFPQVLLHAQRIGEQAVRLNVTLHGVTRTMDVPLKLEQSADTITAIGELSLLQTDFDITPMSVMGGAITVQDRMALAFTLVAVR
ncbi:YceI family protein [Massilia sp. PAMC28688]|uniref:YceI family protein n=1 Tax=Massilia sp. PAMC28688 TaxID=2861283 RepID=UPI001C626A66|nr:YceI family protein [Massilia sp. PAMC28688]QYF92810.1 YceI family protein [Massilia sp. PAMC28688]